ncbi:heparinase II/III-family protein [Devosia sp. LjRoot16]|uniref:heparinase II/III family protein n=1 Tax=Devosia sp. LjRoot16 TaxID=3342271 RepID=UPI003ECFD09A
MKLGWYINRLRSMEPAEVLHRLGEAAKQRISKGRHEGWARYPAPQTLTTLPTLPGLRDRLAGADEATRAAIAAAAASTLAGRFSALGRDWPARDAAELFPQSLWRFDPVTSGAWPGPEAYALEIDFRHDGSRGDIKYVWEFNRLQWLVPLAADLLLTDNAGALAALEAAIASWHAANPPFRGVAWASGIEVALRAISLIVVASLAGDSLSPGARRMIGEILAASRFWLPRFPSRFSSANNHLVAELAGEYLIGLAYGAEPPATRAALIAEIDRQILADGSGAEQTPTYAAFTVELALLCAFAARAAGVPFPESFDNRISACASFIDSLGEPPPALGDDDEGRVLTLGGGEPGYIRSIASAIAGFLGIPGMTPAPGDLRSAIFGQPSAVSTPPDGLTTFSDGGLTVWRGSLAGHAATLSFDHGPLGYLSIAAHGHADALSVTLALDGQPVLVDPGTYLYGSGGAWRDWFRGTPAHNTLTLYGHNQSRISGAFNWADKASALWLGPLHASHDGYVKAFGVTHERRIAPGPDGFAITDKLNGGTEEAELVFQLAGDLDTRIDGDTVLVQRAGAPVLTLRFPSPAIAVARGGDTPGPGGWVAPRFGEKLPADRIVWRGNIGPDGVVTRISVAK